MVGAVRQRGGFAIALLVAVWSAACKPGRAEPASGGSKNGDHAELAEGSSPCKSLRDRLCQQFGARSGECQMAEERIRSFPTDRCLAMLSRYEEEAAAAAVRFVEARKALVSPGQSTSLGPAPSIGNLDAPIVMVLFAAFDRPECSRGSPIATVIRNLYQDKVRLVFRQFPRSGDKDSHLAAEASLAAHAQGKFWRFYEVMFGNEQTHDRAALERYAKAAGLDLPAFDRALDRHGFAADVDADRDLGASVYVTDVPALFVNGRRVEFPDGVAELEALVAEALKS